MLCNYHLTGDRWTAAQYLSQWPRKLFPSFFGEVLHPFIAQLLPLDPDARVKTVADHFDQLLQHMQKLERQDGVGGVSLGCHSGDKAGVMGSLEGRAEATGTGESAGVQKGGSKLPVAAAASSAAAGGGGGGGNEGAPGAPGRVVSQGVVTEAAGLQDGQESSKRRRGELAGEGEESQDGLLGDDFDSLLSDVDLVQKQLQGLRGLRDPLGEEDDGIFLEGEGSLGAIAAVAPHGLAITTTAAAAAAGRGGSVLPSRGFSIGLRSGMGVREGASGRVSGDEQHKPSHCQQQQQQQEVGAGRGIVAGGGGGMSLGSISDGSSSGMVLMVVLLSSLLRGSLLQESKVRSQRGRV
jgi:hypothetical protein